MNNIEQKIEKLIEEAFISKDDSDIAYHYGGPGYKELKNRKMLGLPNPIGVTRKDYGETWSAFPEPLTKEDIKKFRSSGFKTWVEVPLPIYEYKVKISDNIDAFNGPITFTSEPQEVTKEFRFGPWARYLATKGIDFKKMHSNDKYWESIKDKYMKEAESPQYRKLYEQWFKSKYGSPVTANNFSKHPFIKEIKKNFRKYIEKNLKDGRRDQYATYIPHIYTKIKKPLKIYEAKKIM